MVMVALVIGIALSDILLVCIALKIYKDL